MGEGLVLPADAAELVGSGFNFFSQESVVCGCSIALSVCCYVALCTTKVLKSPTDSHLHRPLFRSAACCELRLVGIAEHEHVSLALTRKHRTELCMLGKDTRQTYTDRNQTYSSCCTTNYTAAITQARDAKHEPVSSP